MPLRRPHRRNLCGAFAAMAAIFVQDPIVVPPFPGEAFAKLYGLTGSELRTLLAMAPGLASKKLLSFWGSVTQLQDPPAAHPREDRHVQAD